MTTQLIKYETACRALAECKALDEVKAWADKAAAMQAYGRMAKDKTLEVDAAEIRIRAERRLGQMLAEQKEQGGMSRGAAGNPGGQGAKLVRSPLTTTQTPTLADAGISKDLSSRAQKLAAVPEDEFEAELASKRERDQQDGARVSAKLEAAGAKHMQATAPEDFGPSPEELAEAQRAAEDDAEAVRLLLESDDALAALNAKCKQQAAQIRTLESRMTGMLGELNEARSLAKSWRTKFEKLQRVNA